MLVDWNVQAFYCLQKCISVGIIVIAGCHFSGNYYGAAADLPREDHLGTDP